MLLDSPTIRNALSTHFPFCFLFQKADGGLHWKVVPKTATSVHATVNIHTAQDIWTKRRVWKMWALKMMMEVLIIRSARGWIFCFCV